MKVFPYWGTQIGLGFAIWETGAEIFLPYVMLRLTYKSNKFLRIILRPLLWFRCEKTYCNVLHNVGRVKMNNGIEIIEVTGLVFQIQGAQPTRELWDRTKQEAIDYMVSHPSKFSDIFFYQILMPCGETMTFITPKEIMDLPIKDISCPCRDKTHWFIRFVNYV